MIRFNYTKIQEKALKLIKGPAKYILLYGGSRSGKTRIYVEYIFRMCIKYPGMRVLIARHTNTSVIETLWKQTIADVIKTYTTKYGQEQSYFTTSISDHEVRFYNDSTIYTAGLDDKERLEKILGSEYAIIYLNECSQISYEALNITKTRLAQNIKGYVQGNGKIISPFKNKMFLDENPPGPDHWTNKMFIQKVDPDTGVELKNKNSVASMLMNPMDNIDNLSQDYIDILEAMSERYRRRFLLGEFVGMEGALWSYDIINILTKEEQDNIIKDKYAAFEKIVVSLDPSGNDGDADSCGIAVVGKYLNVDRWCVLEDATDNISPAAWGRKAIALYKKYSADKIIYESNYGKFIVRDLIKGIDKYIPLDDVWSKRGKIIRAVPVAGLYELGKVDHFNDLGNLEYELTAYTEDTKSSPNRLDAAVQGVMYLFDNKRKPRISTMRGVI